MPNLASNNPAPFSHKLFLYFSAVQLKFPANPPEPMQLVGLRPGEFEIAGHIKQRASDRMTRGFSTRRQSA